MLVFPQLLTGAMAQYPIRKRFVQRTIRTEAPGGQTIKMADPDISLVQWDLLFKDLTDDEATALNTFFRDCEGPLRPFVFLDPSGNLLCWSEALSEKAWDKDPYLSVAPATIDPFGGQRASTATNMAGVPQGIQQRVSGPDWFWYNLSAYMRGNGSEIAMRIGQTQKRFVTREQWQRYSVSATSEGSTAGVVFRLDIPGGGRVDVFGMQAEPQAGTSTYKSTGPTGGTYAAARFAGERLAWRSTGPGRHSCSVRIVSNANGF
jgi:hypothetical protein